MIDAGNYAARCRAFEVDPSTWESGDEIGLVEAATVTRDLESDLLQGGSLTVEGSQPSGYVRLVLEADSEGECVREDVATLYVATRPLTRSRERVTCDCELYSVLRPAACRLMPIGWHFPKGGDLVSGALDLIRQAIAAPVAECGEASYASCAIVAEEGETSLSMARLMLEEAGFHLDIDGRGEVRAVRDGAGRASYIDERDSDVISGEVRDELDLFDVPNVVRATDGEGKWAEAVNDDEGSPSSVGSVGFPVMAEASVSAAEGVSMLEAAAAELEEGSCRARTISYMRTYDDLRPGDDRQMNLPSAGLDGTFEIVSQDVDMSLGAMVRETARERVRTFRR